MIARYIVEHDTRIAISWIYDRKCGREVRRSQDIAALKREAERLNAQDRALGRRLD